MRIFDINIPDWAFLPLIIWFFVQVISPNIVTSLFGFNNTTATENDAATAVSEKQIHADSGSFKFSEAEQSQPQRGGDISAPLIAIIMLITGVWLGVKALFRSWDNQLRSWDNQQKLREEVEQLRKERNELQAKIKQKEKVKK